MRFTTTTTAFVLWIGIVCLQTTDSMAQDTSLANQYYAEALVLLTASDASISTKKTAFSLLQQAEQLYQGNKSSEKHIAIIGLQSYNLAALEEKEGAEQKALHAIQLALKYAKENPSILRYANWVMQQIYMDKDYKKSIEYGLKAAKGFDLESNEYFQISENIIRNYVYLRQLDEAENLILQLETLLENQQESEHWLIVYRGKMQLFTVTDNYEKAILFAEKLFSENQKFKKYSGSELGPMYVEMGNAYSGLGKFDEGIRAMKKGIEASGYEEGRPVLGTYYANIGSLYLRKKDLKKAAEFYEKSIQLLAKDTANYMQSIKIIHVNLSAVYYNMDDLTNAEKNIKAARELGLESHGLYLNYANILGKQEKYEEALQLLQTALLDICTVFKVENYLENPSQYEIYSDINSIGSVLLSKGVYLFRLGKLESNLPMMEKGLQTLELTLGVYKRKMENAKGYEATKFLLNQEALMALDYMMYLQKGIYEMDSSEKNLEIFFSILERRKAMQLLETLTSNPLPKLFDEEKDIVKNIRITGYLLDLANSKNQPDSVLFYKNKLFDDNRRLEQFEQKAQKKFPKIAQNIYENKPVSLQKIKAALDEQTLLIEYGYSTKSGYILTIGKDKQTIFAPDFSNLMANIKRLNVLIQSDFSFQKKILDEFIEVSHELYQTLIRPIEAELKGKNKLMIVQEGILFNLPFELLLASNEEKKYTELDFLIKKYKINYHYSATAYLELQARPAMNNYSFLGFAPIFDKNPKIARMTRSFDFDLDSLYRSFQNNYFTSLPNTKVEINTISKMLHSKGETKALIGKKATKNNLSEALKSQHYQFIHIATHGIVNFKNPKLSSIACYASNKNNASLFYASEIQNTDIQADLVILSSCESGIGQLVEGEGMIALNRSFFYAGARNVLFSLWKVDDKKSSELMIDFYKNYLENPSYTDALHLAKLNFLSNPATAEPKYWAAFVLMGE